MKSKMNNGLYSIEGLKKGNKGDFENIYNEFYSVLYSLSLSFVGSSCIAEELVQDSFMKLWERKAMLTSSTNILNYLYTLTKNSALNHLRQREVAERALREYLVPELIFKQKALEELPDTYGELKEITDRIDQTISALPEDVRIIFEKSKQDGLTYAEIAEELGISVKTVEAKMTKALKALRLELADYYPLMLVLFHLIHHSK